MFIEGKLCEGTVREVMYILKYHINIYMKTRVDFLLHI